MRSLAAESDFRVLFGVILDPPQIVQNGNEISIKRPLEVSFWIFGVSGVCFGIDLGVILGAILGSRGRHAIFAEIPPRHSESTIFRGSGGPKMSPK